MQPIDSPLTLLVRRVVEPMGYELVGVEYFQRGAHSATLRVYIDHAAGIGLDDCAAVSHQLSGVLDVEDPLPCQYDLEVSSPGLDRPLVFPEHFARFAGERVRLRLAEKVEGRRRLEGVLAAALPPEGPPTLIRVEAEGRDWEIPLVAVESARLVPDLPRRPGGTQGATRGAARSDARSASERRGSKGGASTAGASPPGSRETDIPKTDFHE